MQKMITEKDRELFELKVNNELKGGWKIVPHSIAISVAVSHPTNSSYAQTLERYVAVLEKTA